MGKILIADIGYQILEENGRGERRRGWFARRGG